MGAALSIIFLILKHVEVVLVTIHEEKDKTSLLLVAGEKIWRSRIV
jgi:hypothetical protein